MTNCSIALIGEDETDCNTVRKIVHRVLGQNVGTKKWASRGSGILKRKLKAQLKNLSSKGCNAFIIIHDLDRNPLNNSLNDEAKLRRDLEDLSSKLPESTKHICIPIEELEAWFWSDPKVVKYVGKTRGKAHPNPHQIAKPKEKLIALSVGENRKPRYSTNMNVELAEKLNLDICSKCCPSFKELLCFLYSLK